jgi:UDP-glucose 4-epimerase
MKCLVTGGAGFIGSHLVTALRASDHDVIVLDNLSTGLEANVPEGVNLRKGHAGDSVLLDEVLPGCACIFHLAAVSSVQASLDHPVSVNDDNLTATLNLLEASKKHGVKRFVFSSSAAIYGDTKGISANEDMEPNPMSNYAVQKIASEYYCRVYARLYGLEAVCLRYFNVFGLRQRADSPYSGAIAKFMEAARLGQRPTVFGDGAQTRDFCAVADVVAANIAAAQAPAGLVAGKSFNIGSGTSISIAEVLAILRDIFPCMPPPIVDDARAGEIQHSCADISLASDILGYRPIISFDTALRELSEHIKKES